VSTRASWSTSEVRIRRYHDPRAGRHAGSGGTFKTALLPREPTARSRRPLQRSAGGVDRVALNVPAEFARTLTEVPGVEVIFTRSRGRKCAPDTTTGILLRRLSEGLEWVAAALAVAIKAARRRAATAKLSRRTPG
jgi:hypothetical protein